MGTFGERLQREREMRGITLDDIAEATKIGTRMLRALEEEQFDRLPGGIFNKGFVRAYARYLGIDEEQAVADYQSALKQSEPITEPARPSPSEDRIEVVDEEAESSRGWPVTALLVLLLVALALGGGYWYNRRRVAQAESAITAPSPQAAVSSPAPSATEPAPPAAAPANRPAKAATPPAGTQNAPKLDKAPGLSAPAAAAPAPEKPSGFVLLVRAREDSWMSITADDKVILDGTLSAAQERSVRAQREIVLKTGNAGGLDLSLNGKALPSLGTAGQVRTVTIGPDGLRP